VAKNAAPVAKNALTVMIMSDVNSVNGQQYCYIEFARRTFHSMIKLMNKHELQCDNAWSSNMRLQNCEREVTNTMTIQ